MEDPKSLNLINKKSLFWWPDHVDVSAWTEHIPFAFWITELLAPKCIVELGVHNGNSYFSFCQAVSALDINTTCYGIDTWQGDEHSGFYSDDVYVKVNDYNASRYAKFSTLIRSDFNEAVSYFPDNSIELLHIDGKHTYEAVKHDFDTWHPKLTKDAFVILHDINVREREFGVFKFWEELKAQHNTLQFDFGYGLGIVSLGSINNSELKSLFERNNGTDYAFLKNYFFERGQGIKARFDFSQVAQKKHAAFEAMSTKYNQLEEHYKTLETHYLQLIDERENFTQENTQLKDTQLTIKSDFNELEKEKSGLEKKIAELKKAYIQLQDEYEVNKENSRYLKSVHQESVTGIKRLSENFNSLLVQHSQLKILFEKSADQLTGKLNETESELHQANKGLKAYQETVTELNRVILWYKSTFEDRSIAGTMKEKLKALFKKRATEKSAVTAAKSLPTRELINETFSMRPANDLTRLSGSQLYQSTGSDPYFIIDLNGKTIDKGWYFLSVEVKAVEGIIVLPRLYFDTGRGFNETNSWNLTSQKTGQIEAVFHLPQPVTQMRFDPTTAECSFYASAFQLTAVNQVQVFKYAFRKFKESKTGNRTFPAMRNLFSLFTESGITGVRNKLYNIIANRDDTYEEKYRKWCLYFDTISVEELKTIKSLSDNLSYRPIFSIVMPVYNAPVKFLKKAIESVINQAYPAWELCIADDKSTNEEIRSVLQLYQKKDARIKVTFRQENGHISRASNSALELATGEYIALLDQDDELPLHSLYEVAYVINQNPQLELIYSDEDKIDEQGKRFDPYFKTDWNKDLFYGQNMISHLGVYKHSLIKEVGGFRVGFEGSQDYDLALRCIEKLRPDQIYHIPHVLYHWRAIKGSTAVTVSNKNYAMVAGLKALQEHLINMNETAKAIENVNSSYRVIWPLPAQPPMVSIIIPTKDKVEILETCVSSVLTKTDYPNFEILIIDNQSSEPGTLHYLEEVQKLNNNVFVHEYSYEFNFSAIINYGVKHAKGEIVLLLNNDTEVINEEWMREMVSHCMREEIGAVGAKLYYPNEHIQHAGVFLYDGHPGNHIYLNRLRNDLGYFNKLNLIQNYSAVTGACLAVRKTVFLEAGGFDEVNLKVAYNDVDFCLKLRESGYLNVWTPFAELYHHESISRGDDLHEINYNRFKKEQSYMLKKWKEVVARDPYFNPNLYVETQSNQFAFPPRLPYEWQKEQNVKLKEKESVEKLPETIKF